MTLAKDKRRTHDLPKRILFLNDVGFQYGAGVAQARQVEAILQLGIETGVLAWSPSSIRLEDVATRPIDADLWLGIREVNHLEGGKKLPEEAVIAGLLMEVARFSPQIVIVGNLHGAHWPFRLLPALRAIGCRVMAFLHDAYLFTGRCAYPGSCKLYLTGCNETCPTPNEYPKLPPALIGEAWQLRRDIFGGDSGVEIIANSRWSERMFRTALPACKRVETIYLGTDEFMYKPGDKLASRRRLGLPEDRPVVLCAAVNFQEKRKGCEHLREIIAALQDTVTFAAIGHNAHEIPGLVGLGHHITAARLAEVYQAADLFLGTATEEAFGQTLMEAQLCGVSVIAFQTGGVEEIVRNEITGKLIPNRDSAAAVEAIRTTLADVRFMKEAGKWSRQYAVSRFSMWAHEQGWHFYLAGHLKVGTGHNPPDLSYPFNEKLDLASTETHRPSWSHMGTFVSETHRQIFEKTSGLPGWQTPGDSFKLFEMGYHAGDVILEIGTYGGRSATVALRGALDNHVRTCPPQYYGVDIDGDSIARTRGILAEEMLGDRCHLFHGNLQEFVKRWDISPTMVFLDGDHSHEGVAADLATLRDYLKPGTPVLVHDYLNIDKTSGTAGVRSAANAWKNSGYARFIGCFGCSALYLTL